MTNFILIDSPDKKEIKPFGTPYEEFVDKSSPAIMDVPEIDEDDMISICYTSGTTGKPKGIKPPAGPPADLGPPTCATMGGWTRPTCGTRCCATA